MSVKYVPVQWNTNKYLYDFVLIALIAAYILAFLNLAPQFLDHTKPTDGAIIRARAFGTCAFLMLTIILCIGPLARLDTRFLPLLYNRRHFGVLTAFVALSHALFVLNWYFNFSPQSKLEGLLAANTSYGQLLGFPFEVFGIFGLLCLAILAATSHDFWLSFLTPPVWKAMHYLIYPTYAAIIAHVGLGSLQSQDNQTFTIVVGISTVLVCGLHVFAAIKERSAPSQTTADDGWHVVGDASEIEEGRAKITMLANGNRVAVFRHEAKLSAISNACAHQNGPLGEGRIIDGCVTCPWHGFQYRVADGCSPAPFTEKVPTYRLRLDGTTVLVDPEPNAPGVHVEPVPLPEALK